MSADLKSDIVVLLLALWSISIPIVVFLSASQLNARADRLREKASFACSASVQVEFTRERLQFAVEFFSNTTL